MRLLCYPCSRESSGVWYRDIWAGSPETIVGLEQHSCVHAALHTESKNIAETSFIHWDSTWIYMKFVYNK